MSSIKTSSAPKPNDLSPLSFLSAQSIQLLTITTTPAVACEPIEIDAATRAGVVIFLEALARRRRRGLEEGGPELDAVRAAVLQAAARLDELAGRDQRGVADDGDEIAPASSFDPQNAEAVLGIME